MIRKLFCAALVFALSFGAAMAADTKKDEKKPDAKKPDTEKKPDAKKPEKPTAKPGKPAKGSGVAGVIKKFDAGSSTLTLSLRVKKGEPAAEKEIKLPEGVKIVVLDGENKKELTGKDGFAELKEGARAIVAMDADGKVVAVRLGNKKPK